jgi:isocitrate dehydrogenase (NAD+)
MILSSILMLRHLGQNAVADRIENAIDEVYAEGRKLTRDVGGTASTDEFLRAVIGSLR